MDGVKDGIVSYNNLLYFIAIRENGRENGEQENTVWFYQLVYKKFFRVWVSFFKYIWYSNKYKQLDHTATPLSYRQMLEATGMPNNHSSLLFEKKGKTCCRYYLLT